MIGEVQLAKTVNHTAWYHTVYFVQTHAGLMFFSRGLRQKLQVEEKHEKRSGAGSGNQESIHLTNASIRTVSYGLGIPVFSRVQSTFAHALMSVKNK